MQYLPNGATLSNGRYKIVRFISAGGFGCTYEAEFVTFGERVAIKEFFVKDFCNRNEETSEVTIGITSRTALVNKLKKKFVDEARSIRKLEHPNIVKVSDVFEENGTAYYVMDYIDGSSLNDIIKKSGAMPEKKALRYIHQICDALKYVHSQNRLHLDIKPGNIMVDGQDNAILIDFGASKQYDEESGENTSTLLGKTPSYAPIEQMGNTVQTFTPATDIYSLGATLYKMLTGITPPEASALVTDDESLRPLPSYISTETRKAVEAAMKVEKKERPQTIEDFKSLLNGNIKSKGSSNNSKTDSHNASSQDNEATLIIDSTPKETAKTPVSNHNVKELPNKSTDINSPEKNLTWAFLILAILIPLCIFTFALTSTCQHDRIYVPAEEVEDSVAVDSTAIDSLEWSLLDDDY